MRESFLNILHGGQADEIVWTADLTYWIDGQMQQGTGDPAWRTERGFLDLCRDVGCMPYYWYDGFLAAEPEYDGVEVATETRGADTVQTWTTPVGRLVEKTTFVVESCSQACTKHPVENEADLATLVYVLEHRRLAPTLEGYAQRLSTWATYDGVPALGMPRSPLPALFVEWAGAQNGVYLMLDYPELVARVLELFEVEQEPIVDALCDLAPPVVHIADNLTSEVYTGYFDGTMAGLYRRRVGKLHAAGVACAVHLDGTVRGLLPKLAEVGFDAVEALTPMPVGDVGVEEMRDLAGSERVVLWGGLPGAMFADPYTWDDMRRHLGALLESWRGAPFVIGVADQVPANGRLDLCRKVSDYVKDLSP